MILLTILFYFMLLLFHGSFTPYQPGGGFLTADLIAKIDALLHKAVRWGYSCELKCLSELLHDADETLFNCMLTSGHCIHQLLPTTKVIPMKLRSSQCVFALPHCHYNLYKYSFVMRNLFDQAY